MPHLGSLGTHLRAGGAAEARGAAPNPSEDPPAPLSPPVADGRAVGPRDRGHEVARPIALLLSAYVLAGGAASFLAWPLDLPRLADWDADGISVQPNAALAAALGGLGVMALATRRRWAAAAIGGLVAALAGATLAQHLFAVDVGIDRLLLFDRTWGGHGTLSPGRMGPPGAATWTLVGVALALGGPAATRRAVPVLGVVAAAITGIAMVGYLFGADRLYSLPTVTVIALQSSTFLFAASLGLVAAVPEHDPMRTMLEDSGAGVLARLAMPPAVVLPVLVGAAVVTGLSAGVYDAAMALAVMAVSLTFVVCGVLWWGVGAVRARERAVADAGEQLRLAHASLRANEARMNAFLQQLPIGVGMADVEGRWVYGNPGLEPFVGTHIPGRDPAHDTRWRTWDPDGQPIDPGQWPAARALRGETVTGMEFLHTLADGAEIWTRVAAVPFRDERGAVAGAVVIVQDVDAQKRAARALAQAERQLRVVTDHVPALIAQCDVNGRCTFVNRACAERFGLRPDQILGRPIADVLGEPAHDALRRHVETALAGEPVEFETEIPSAAGTQFMHVAYAPERDAGGRVVGLIAAIVNISDRKRAEDALREANVRKDHFLAMLAHELRNPLAPLVSSLGILHHASGDAATVDRVRQTMERQVGLMVRLIDDLMDIGRLAFNKLSLQRAPATLSSIVRDAVDGVRPTIDIAGQTLDVTAPSATIYLDGDPARLTQSLGNLLNNASKFSHRGGRIQLEVTVDGRDVEMRVSDHGIGLAPEMLPRVFDMFTQADASLERSRGGLGIGLALARQLIEMHGGSLTAKSEGLGLGSEFTVRLPGLVIDPPRQAPAPPPARLPDVARVLVVDDNRDAALSLEMLFGLHGVEVDLAHDGPTAITKAAARRYDAILLDIGMPTMNGYDVCREMRRQPWGAAVTILAMTGWGQEEDRRRSREAGFDDHLVKPVDHASLLMALARRLAAQPAAPMVQPAPMAPPRVH